MASAMCFLERPRSFGPLPPQKILVDTTRSERFHPLRRITRPITLSAFPASYASALSKKLTPASNASCMHCSAASSPT